LPPGNRVLLVNHDAFAYFGAAYGLSFVPLQGLSPDPMASASDFPYVADRVKQQNISLFFTENVDPPRLMKGMEALTGGKIAGKLYSDALSKEETGATYIGMMKANADAIFNALSQ
jgi:zinc/manganese transport system substrate-binding protein